MPLQDLITFKWKEFGWFIHFFGCCIHLIYIVLLFMYNYLVYIKGTENIIINYILLFGILYPALYEFAQMYMCDDYWKDLGNYIDLIYIWCSVAMTFIHAYNSPYSVLSEILMCLVSVLAVRRTFNFLKIFEALSPIVTMLSVVILDLKAFMTFYFIQCLLFSLMIGVIGLQNPYIPGKF